MLERLSQQVSPYRNARRWYVAYSGGLDSHVLLHALSALLQKEPGLPSLVAVHVNHQIQPMANDWEEHCRQQATDIAVEYLSFRVDVDVTGNVEDNARKARYEVFSGLLEEGDCIFMAHQQDDNVETFFYRLFRGAGLHGLLAINQVRPLGKGVLVRPLLSFSREQLECYANMNHLQYVNDPSNTDIHFDRNYIRHQVLPLIRKRWPAIDKVIGRAISHLREAQALLDEFAAADLACVLGGDVNQPSIDLAQVLLFSESRQKNLLRFWLQIHDISLSSQQTDELFRSVIHAPEDAQPMLAAGCHLIRRFKRRLYVTGHDDVAGFGSIAWNGMEACEVPGFGCLQIIPPVDIQLEVRSRQGGEQIKPVSSPHTRKVKTLLQDMQVAPWQREKLPLVFHQGELIAVADLVLSENGKSLLKGGCIFCSKPV